MRTVNRSAILACCFVASIACVKARSQAPAQQGIQVARPSLAPAQQSAQAKTASDVSVAMTYKGVVTGSFLRVHSPQLVASMVDEVRKGKRTRESLQGIVSPTVLNALTRSPAPLTRRITLQPVAPAASANTQRAATQLTAPSVGIAPRSATQQKAPSWQSVLKSNSVAELPSLVDFSPTRIDFPDVGDGQKITARISVITPTDGPVQVSFPVQSPFKIEGMYLYDGTLAVSSGNRYTAVRHTASSKTSAPWNMDAAAGQEIDIIVAFEPHFDLVSFGAGWYESKLTVSGRYWNENDPKENPWSITLPARGRFTGLNLGKLGVSMVSEDYDPVVIRPPSYNPREPQQFSVPVRFFNVTNAVQTGTVRPAGLPTGVTMTPLSVSVRPGEVQRLSLAFQVDRSGGIWGEPDGTQNALSVVLDTAGTQTTLNETLVMYSGFHHWSVTSKCGSVDFNADLFVQSSGDFTFSAGGFNNNLIFGYDISFDGRFDNVQYVNDSTHVDSDSNFSTSFGFLRPEYQEHYLEFIQKTFNLHTHTQ